MIFSEILEQHVEEAVLDIASFVREVSKYDSLDSALMDLPEEYLEFYSKNEKILTKPLKKLKLLEGTESPGHLGTARANETVRKKVKYKGEIIILEWDNDSGVWIPWVAKRSIVQALRYGKLLVDQQD